MTWRGDEPFAATDGSAVVALEPPMTSALSHLSFVALMSVLFLTFLDNTVVSPVLTNVQAELHAGVPQLQWVVGAYALAFASLMLVSGSLGDLLGRKPVMLIGVAIFIAGSIISALAKDPTVLILGRIVMGVGAAGSEPGTLSMIRHIYPERQRRARALGAWAAVSGLALAAGPVIGGVLVGLWSWRAIFWFNVFFGGAALIIALVALPNNPPDVRAPLDVVGFVLSTVSLATATFATIRAESIGYAAPSIIAMYAISFASIIAFIVVESRVRSPMLNLRYFGRRTFLGANFVAFTTYFSIFSIFFFVALYLEVVVGVGAYQLALDFLPLLAGMVAASLFSGRWVARTGSRTPMIVGSILAAAGVFLTNLVIDIHVGLGTLGWTMGLAGIGFGIVVVPVTSDALQALPAAHSGMAASTVNTARELGAVAGVSILGSIVNGQLTVHLTQRLIQIGVPASYRAEIIAALTTGTIGAKARQYKGGGAAVEAIINKVVNAAYGAFTNGLHIALLVASGLMVLSALTALVGGTGGVARRAHDAETFD